MDPSDRVFDVEDDDPDPAVVVDIPEGETITEWTYEVDGEDVSAAESNPEYPADEQLVIAAFEGGLDEYWPDWVDAEPGTLFDGVREHGVNHFGFPERRLRYRSPPTALEAVLARVAPAVDTVEWNLDHQLLVVEKLGETYAIAPDGTVQGDGVFVDRLADLVAGPPQ